MSRKNRGDRSTGKPDEFWEDQVHLFLVNGGLEGRTQTSLIRRFKCAIETETLKNYMETLWHEGKVDKFTVPHSSGRGKPSLVWRATTKMLES